MGQSLLAASSAVVLHYTDPAFAASDMFSEFFFVEKLESLRPFIGYGVAEDPGQHILPGPLAVLDMIADISPILELYFPKAGAVMEQLTVRSRINIAMFQAFTARL